MKSIAAIKKFFGEEKPITLMELKHLTQAERLELGRLSCEALGEVFET